MQQEIIDPKLESIFNQKGLDKENIAGRLVFLLEELNITSFSELGIQIEFPDKDSKRQFVEKLLPEESRFGYYNHLYIYYSTNYL